MIEVKNLSFSFKKKSIFENASFDLEDGTIYGLVAPNGYGKTTLLQLIDGLIKPKAGEIKLFGKANKAVDKKEIAFLQDNTVLYPYLSSYDHLKFLCELHKLPISRIDQVAEQLKLAHFLHQKVKSYSLGMKQRLLLAMAIIKEPKVLLLDEPLNGLDPSSRLIVRETLLHLAENNVTMLISSHDLSELDRLTKNIFFIREKQVHFEKLQTVNNQHLSFTVENPEEVLAILTEHFTGEVELVDDTFFLHFESNQILAVLSLLVKHQITPLSLQAGELGSEDRYKEMFGGEV